MTVGVIVTPTMIITTRFLQPTPLVKKHRVRQTALQALGITPTWWMSFPNSTFWAISSPRAPPALSRTAPADSNAPRFLTFYSFHRLLSKSHFSPTISSHTKLSLCISPSSDLSKPVSTHVSVYLPHEGRDHAWLTIIPPWLSKMVQYIGDSKFLLNHIREWSNPRLFTSLYLTNNWHVYKIFSALNSK